MQTLYFLGSVIASVILSVGSWLYLSPAPQNVNYAEEIRQYVEEYVKEGALGATNPIAGSTYALAGSGISSSATSITLQSLTITQTGQKIQDSDLSDTFYITIDPGNRTRQEIVSCSTLTQNAAGTATLSGCSRGLSPITPFTASSSLQFTHAGGAQVIFSDPPQLFNLYAAKDNIATITAPYIFSSSSVPRYDFNPTFGSQGSTTLASKGYVDNTASAGASDSNQETKGLLERANRTEARDSAADGSGNTTAPLALTTSIATSTCSSSLSLVATSAVLVTGNNGFLSTLCMDFFTTRTISASTTFLGTTTISRLSLATSTTYASSSPWSWYALDQGSGDAYAVQLSPNPMAYQPGMRLAFKPNSTSTESATINVNGLGVTTIKGLGGIDLRNGDIRTNIIANLIYDGTNFQLQNSQRESSALLATSTIATNVAVPASFTDLWLGWAAGTNTSVVMLKVLESGSGSGIFSYVFRRNGDSSEFPFGANAASTTPGNAAYIIVPTDNQGIVEWKCGSGTCGNATVVLEAVLD